MSDKEIATLDNAKLMEQVLIGGDLSKLTTSERLSYYTKVCESIGLNPLTKPFDYITLNGKLTLYAKRDAADQLRKRDNVSIVDMTTELVEDLYIVKVTAKTKDERYDSSTGVIYIGNLKGVERANAMMKCETKAKRRVTLSICGLGWLDETEVETITDAKPEGGIVDGEIIQKFKPSEGETFAPQAYVGKAEPARIVMNWAGSQVDADAPLTSKITSSPKFQQVFGSKYENEFAMKGHLKKHFGVEKAADLTWEQAIAWHTHLYLRIDHPVYYPAKKQSVVGGLMDTPRTYDEVMAPVQKLYEGNGQAALFGVLATSVTGSPDGNKMARVLTQLLGAIGTAFSNPPTEEDVQEMKDTLKKEFAA